MREKIIKWIGIGVQCLLGVALLWWVMVAYNVDGSQVLLRISQTSVVLLLLGSLCFVASMSLIALRYHLFLPSYSIPISYLFGTSLIQNALLTFIPWRMGEASYPLLLSRDYKVPITQSSAVILAIRLVDLLVILIVALLGGSKLGLSLSLIAIMLAVTIAGALLLLYLSNRADMMPYPVIQMFFEALQPLRRMPQLLKFLCLSLAIFLMTTLQSFFILRAVAFLVGVLDVAILNALSLLSALLPIHPPGGWGTIDSIQVLILNGLGYQMSVSVSAILAAHTLYTLLILAGGGGGWLVRLKNKHSLRDTQDV